jgi:uncharacterized protein YjbJ (UPF0337 family)
MKQRSSNRSPEFKGVVKKITGKLTSDADLEREGCEEMLDGKSTGRSARTDNREKTNPDPHRRG